MNDPNRNSWLAWLQLMRLPNVFTALADVAMGYLVTHGDLQPYPHFALLAIASCSLYLSGMVLNDVFDSDVDAREQPSRPIPSGRISKRAAAACGLALLLTGILLGCLAAFVTRNPKPAIVSGALAACIVLYDRILKQTSVAPAVMGACRSLNVLLGMSLAKSMVAGLSNEAEFFSWESPATWMIAFGIGVYVTGVTWFARTDAHESRRGQLIGGTIVLLAGILILASVPHWNESDINPQLVIAQNGWYLLWIAIAVIISRRCLVAILNPKPSRVQAAVRHSVHALIALDAAVCVGYVGANWGIAVLLLLVPTILLTSWLKAT